jgi:hypothetical protein
MNPYKNEILLDTNTFGKFPKRNVDLEKLKAWKLFCTTAQRVEIDNTNASVERELLQRIFKTIDATAIDNPITPYGLGYYGVSRYADPDKIKEFYLLKEEIKQLDLEAELKGDKKLKNRSFEKQELNWAADAMVLQGAIVLGDTCVMVTKDRTLIQLCKKYGIKNAKFKTLVEKINWSEPINQSDLRKT